MKNIISWMKKRSKRRRTEKWAHEAKRQIKLIAKQITAEKAAVEALIEQLRSITTRQVFDGDDGGAARSSGQIYRRTAMRCALLMIRRYCACLLHHLPLLAAGEPCFPALPSVVQEAVAGMMFASRRCDSPELAVAMTGLSEILEERYAPEGGEALRVIDGKVDRALRVEYLGEGELGEDVKFRLGRLVASRGDLGLKFQLGRERIESLFRVTEEAREEHVEKEEGRYDSYDWEEHEMSFKTCDGMGSESVSVSDEDDRSIVHS